LRGVRFLTIGTGRRLTGDLFRLTNGVYYIRHGKEGYWGIERFKDWGKNGDSGQNLTRKKKKKIKKEKPGPPKGEKKKKGQDE